MTFTLEIIQGEKEPIIVLVVGTDGIPLAGKTNIKIKIHRNSDGYYFDWSDNTFKTELAVVTMLWPLSEISATGSPGEYQLNKPGHVRGFDTATITNPLATDDYIITCIQDGGSDASNVPMIGELKVSEPDVIVDRTPVIF